MRFLQQVKDFIAEIQEWVDDPNVHFLPPAPTFSRLLTDVASAYFRFCQHLNRWPRSQ